MIKLKDLLTEQEWMSGPPPGKGAGHPIFSAVNKLESRLRRERSRQIAAIDKKINSEVKKELRGNEKDGVRILDARWREIGGEQGIEVKLAGGRGSI